MAIDKKTRSENASTPAPAAPRDMKRARTMVGLNVVISILVAAALVLAINVLSNYGYIHKPLESLGHYGLSDSTRKILSEVHQDVKVTSIYTSAKPEYRDPKDPDKYAARVRDLLDEMHQYNHDIAAVSVTSDRQKQVVMGHLRERLDKAAAQHIKVVTDFLLLASTQSVQLDQMAKQWQEYPQEGWLEQFGIGKRIETDLSTSNEELKKVAVAIRQEQGAGLPNYPAMGKDVQEALDTVTQRLKQIKEGLVDLAGLPEKVDKQRSKLVVATAAVSEAVTKAGNVLGGPASQPADPSATLDKAGTAIAAILDAAKAAKLELLNLDKASGGYVEAAHAWVVGKWSLPVSYDRIAYQAGQLAELCQGARQAATPQYQKDEVIPKLRQHLGDLLADAAKAAADTKRLIAELTTLDDPTRQVFKQAKADDFLDALITPMEKILDVKLPKLEDQEKLTEQIRQENIVLVEVGGKTGVVGFDEVWPLVERRDPMDMSKDEQSEKRVFNGDAAIAAKILSMAREPFGEVVLTYFEQIPPPQMRQQMPAVVGPLPSVVLRTLRQRLEKANLKVTDWNLAQPGKEPEWIAKLTADSTAPASQPTTSATGTPRVLLILPPPETPPMGMPGQETAQFGPAQVGQISQVIAAGNPAIFLAGYFWPSMGPMGGGPPVYGLGDYLRSEWGLDVNTSLLVLQGIPDDANPGRFKIPITRLQRMPVSTFTDNPIGKPLKARRMLWLMACPIRKAPDSKIAASIEDILQVPVEFRNMWASAAPEKTIEQIRTGQIGGLAPNPADGDLVPPFALAMQSTRDIAGKKVSVVALGVGFSFNDGYMTEPSYRVAQEEILKPEPPPTGDLDLVVNSAYHLLGKEAFIGAGPTLIQPIAQVSEATMRTVKVVFGIVWPLVVILAGFAVMLKRR